MSQTFGSFLPLNIPEQKKKKNVSSKPHVPARSSRLNFAPMSSRSRSAIRLSQCIQ